MTVTDYDYLKRFCDSKDEPMIRTVKVAVDEALAKKAAAYDEIAQALEDLIAHKTVLNVGDYVVGLERVMKIMGVEL